MEKCKDCHSEYLVKKSASLCEAVTKINDDKLPVAHQRIDDLERAKVSMRLFMWVFGFVIAAVGVVAGMSIANNRDTAIFTTRLEQIEKTQNEIKIMIEKIR